MVYISLLTCSPGKDLYAAYGHTAIRVVDEERQTDLCYNYGTFSFDTEHFYWKFVRGETYYSLTVQPTPYFFYNYIEEHRQVYEQRLNLSQAQAMAVRDALEVNCLPENSDYLYNFVFDNCATRPYHLLKEVLQDSVSSTYRGWEGRTYRDFIRHYTRPHTVQDALINMVFGSKADQPMHGEERLFLPEELMYFVEQTTLSNGSRLVQQSHIGRFRIRRVAWWENIYFYLALFAVVMTVLSYYDRRRGHLSYGVDIALCVLYVSVLAIVVFLIYFSIHPLVGWNWRLAVVPTLHLCARMVYIIR